MPLVLPGIQRISRGTVYVVLPDFATDGLQQTSKTDMKQTKEKTLAILVFALSNLGPRRWQNYTT